MGFRTVNFTRFRVLSVIPRINEGKFELTKEGVCIERWDLIPSDRIGQLWRVLCLGVENSPFLEGIIREYGLHLPYRYQLKKTMRDQVSWWVNSNMNLGGLVETGKVLREGWAFGDIMVQDPAGDGGGSSILIPPAEWTPE